MKKIGKGMMPMKPMPGRMPPARMPLPPMANPAGPTSMPPTRMMKQRGTALSKFAPPVGKPARRAKRIPKGKPLPGGW